VSGVVEGQRLRLVSGQPGEVVLLGDSGRIGRILLQDIPREDAARAVAAVSASGARPWLISGDSEEVAARIGARVGIARVHGRVSPEGKAALLKQAAEEGLPTLFVGDGLNDGPALAAARAGLAMRDAATSSLLVADGVVTGGLRGVAGTLAVARVVRRVVAGTLRLSATYNLLAVGAALVGLVNPLVAAILMPLSSLAVVTSALLVEPLVQKEEARWTS
jgi:P-type E1-E2 ATPase